MDKWMDEETDIKTDRRMDTWKDEQTYRRTDKGLMGGRTDIEKDVQITAMAFMVGVQNLFIQPTF
jgi:hypothetical protein